MAERDKRFSPQIQSLRALLALTVAAGHSFSIYSPGASFDAANYLHYVVFQAGNAVMIFFIISGYVVSESQHRYPAGYFDFVIRRIVRLYPLAAVSVFLGLLYVTVSPGLRLTGASDWFNKSLFALGADAPILPNLLLYRWDFNGVLWSIWAEIGAALALPLLIVAHRRGTIVQGSVFAALTAWFALTDFTLSRYLVFFYAGLFVSTLGQHVTGRMVIASAGLLVASNLAQVNGIISNDLNYAMAGLTGFAFVSFAVHRARFRSRWLEALGNMSFSFYAVHLIVMHAVAMAILPKLPMGHVTAHVIVTAVSIGIAVAIARPLYLLVELPSARWGRRLSIPAATIGPPARGEIDIKIGG